jgi:pimeloyl-ACP methyl ester carboxylesterase
MLPDADVRSRSAEGEPASAPELPVSAATLAAERAMAAQLARIRRGLRLAERLHPALAAWMAGRLFISPRRHRRPEREAALLRDAERLTMRAGGKRLAAWSWGAGPAVLLVHGWEGRGSQMAAFAAPLVARGHRVVALDGPAHGDSEGRTTTLPEFGAALLDAEQALGGLHGLVAHSFGAASASYALCRGLAPTRLVYVGPASGAEGAVSRFTAMVGASEPVLERMRLQLERRTGARLAELVTERLCTGHAQPPLLVMHDGGDREVPVEEARAIAAHWRGAELVVTTGLGHRRILRDADVVARAVEFLTGA